MRYLDGPRPRFFAHRGGALEAPENTLEAFAAGIAAGAERLELDVHGTLDGRIVVIHDEALDRTTNGSGLVRQTKLAAIQSLDAGARFIAADGTRPFCDRGVRVPTLDELLERLPGVPLNIEIKQLEPPIEAEVLALLDRFAAREQVLLAAEKGVIMERIRSAAPDILTGFSVEDVAAFLSAWQGGKLASYRAPGVALQVPPSFAGRPLVTEESLAVAHGVGLEVHVWTIDTEAEMEDLLHIGVDGLMTDRPALAAEVFRRRGLR